jgi:hypothetical protein
VLYDQGSIPGRDFLTTPSGSGTHSPSSPVRTGGSFLGGKTTGAWSWLLTSIYEAVSKSFRTGRLERELQMVQLSAIRCSCIAILWVSQVSFVITLCVASQRVFVISLSTQSGNLWIHPRNAEVRNARSLTSTSSYVFISCSLMLRLDTVLGLAVYRYPSMAAPRVDKTRQQVAQWRLCTFFSHLRHSCNTWSLNHLWRHGFVCSSCCGWSNSKPSDEIPFGSLLTWSRVLTLPGWRSCTEHSRPLGL